MRTICWTMVRAVIAGLLAITASRLPLQATSSAQGRDGRNPELVTGSTNHLGSEKSPYLLDHAHDGVNWYPWSSEPFRLAEKENKLIFLSVGYASCHWCHVMQHENFQDPEVAQLLNRSFVAILVDREERPEVDRKYMAACELLTGSGGWPLNVIMTPAGIPFFASGYIPKSSTAEQVGMLNLIPKIAHEWESNPNRILKNAGKINHQISRRLQAGEAGDDLGQPILNQAFQQLADKFDSAYGGFGGAPKFPPFLEIDFLFHYWKRSHDPKALAMAEKTLDALSAGAIADQIGFGFHRYAVDAGWRIPHFEKMLYDQAQAADAYIEAYQATGQERFAAVARNTFDYVSRRLTAADGAFYDAEDADSEGVEGKFYLWTEQQIGDALGDGDSLLVKRAFGITAKGNSPSEGKGENILYRKLPPSKLAVELGIPEAALRLRMESARKALFLAREKRVHPARDEKVLTCWNALMISAYAKGAQSFGDSRYEEIAQRAADFILSNLAVSQDGRPDRLNHSYFDHEASGPGDLDDYAYLIEALLDLYETNFKIRNLQAALDLTGNLIKHFWDDRADGFFYTSDDDHDQMLERQKSYQDSDLPSGNSVAAIDLIRLANMTENAELEEKAIRLERAISGEVRTHPDYYPALLLAADFELGPSYEVVIVGNSKTGEIEPMLRALRTCFVPNKVVVLRPTEASSPEITHLATFTQYQTSIGGKATAYVCQKYHCELPVTEPAKMLALLGVKTPPAEQSTQ